MSYTFQLDTEAAATEQNSGALDTGIYPVTINSISLDKTKNGNNTANISFTTNKGLSKTIYGMCMDKKWTSGADNFDYDKWNRIAALCGLKTGEVGQLPLKKDDGTPVMKDGSQVVLDVFKESIGAKVQLAIQLIYDAYNGEAKEKNEIYEVFTEDGKTYNESTSNSPAEKLEKIKSRLKDKKTKAYEKLMSGGGEQPAYIEKDDDDIL
jgi:hypothetical protein